MFLCTLVRTQTHKRRYFHDLPGLIAAIDKHFPDADVVLRIAREAPLCEQVEHFIGECSTKASGPPRDIRQLINFAVSFSTFTLQSTRISMCVVHVFFPDADIVIAVHGAALTNDMFMLPGSALIEVLPWPCGWIHMYECQMFGNGVRYHQVSCVQLAAIHVMLRKIN